MKLQTVVRWLALARLEKWGIAQPCYVAVSKLTDPVAQHLAGNLMVEQGQSFFDLGSPPYQARVG